MDYAAEIKRIKATNPNANVNDLIDAGMNKLNADSALKQKYGTAWDNLKNQYYTAPAPTMQPMQTTQPIQTATVDNLSAISQMYDQQAAAQAERIRAARDSQISGYNSQIAQAPQQYQASKDEASFVGARQANAIKEAMAAGGQGISGANLSAQSANNAATTGSIATLNASQQNLVNSLKKAIADAQSAASSQELESNASTNAQKIQAILSDRQQQFNNSLNQSSTNANIANTQSNTAYQNLVNAGYPSSQAAQLAQTIAQTKNVQLNNEAQQIANKYAPQIQQGQINEQALKIKYQELVNAGYNKEQAADIASKYANIAQGNRQLDISQQNATTNAAQLEWSKSPQNPDNINKLTTKTEQTNADYSEDYTALKNMTVSDAKTAMNNNWAAMIAKYGPDGATKLWNTVMADAIKVGQAEKR